MIGVDATKKKRLAVHVVSMIEGGAGRKVNELDGEVPEKERVCQTFEV